MSLHRTQTTNLKICCRKVGDFPLPEKIQMIYRFNEFELDTDNYQLRKNGDTIAIEPQNFDLLRYLVERPNQVVLREEIVDSLWPGRIIADTSLSSHINSVRKALDDNGTKQLHIKTIHGRGYQFISALQKSTAHDHQLTQRQPLNSHAALPSSYGPIIMVLPFKNLSSDPRQDFFAEGMSEDITTELCRFSDIRVIARHTAFQYRHALVDFRDLAEKFAIDYLIEGSVQRRGNTLRITVKLSETKERTQLWAEKYDGGLHEVFQVQDDIIGRAVSTLSGRIRHIETSRAKRRVSENLTAYEHLLLGLSHHKNGAIRRIDFQNSAREFEQAIELDPHFIRPQAWIICARAGATAELTPDFIDASLAEAKRVVALDETESESQRVLGAIYATQRNFDMGNHHLTEALTLSPNDSHIRIRMGRHLNMINKNEAAIATTRQAMKLNPLHPGWYWLEMGISYYNLGEYAKALEAFARNREPTDHDMAWMAATHIAMGNKEQARQAAQQALAIDPNNKVAMNGEVEYYQDEAMSDLFRQRIMAAGIPVAAG